MQYEKAVLADAIIVIYCYHSPHSVTWWVVWLGQSIQFNSCSCRSI